LAYRQEFIVKERSLKNMRLILLTIIILTIAGCSEKESAKEAKENDTDYSSPEYLKSIFPGSFVLEKPSSKSFTIEIQNKLEQYIGKNLSLAAYRIDILKDSKDIYIVATPAKFYSTGISTRIKATEQQIAFLLETTPNDRHFSYSILFRLKDIRTPVAILTSEVKSRDSDAFSEIKLESPYQCILYGELIRIETNSRKKPTD
jgi:hypothetical protein